MGGMARPRTPTTVLNMVIAMLVVLIPIALITWFFTKLPEPQPNVVDPTVLIAEARREAPYPVLAPANLPEGWVATRARWTPEGQPLLNQDAAVGNTWQLGYLTPQRMYIGLDQRDRLPDKFIDEVTRGGRQVGTSSLAGVEWLRFTSTDGRTNGLVQRGDAAVTVITGDLPFEALEAFAGTLTSG